MNISDRTLKPSKFVDKSVIEPLQQSAGTYRDLFELAYDVFLFVNKTGNILDINSPAVSLTGYSKAELCKMNVFRELVISEDRKTMRQVVKNAVQNKSSMYEVRWSAKGGKIIQFEGRTTARRSVNGQFISTLCILRDTTESKQAQESLKTSDERYRRILEDQTEFIVRWRPDGIRTFVNESYCRYYGLKQEEVLGSSFFPLISEEDREAVRRRISLLNPQEPVSTGEHKVLRPDGTIGWNQWTDRAFFNEHGEVIEYQSVGRDITERRRAEEKLRESEERFRLVFEEGPIGMHLVDPSFHFVRVNNALCEMLGYTEEELVGLPLADVVHPGDAKLGLELAQKMRDGEIANYQIERRYTKKNKEVVWTNLNASVIRDRDGTALYGIGIVENISERKLAGEALRNALSEVEELKNRLQEENIYLQNEIKVEHNFGEIIGVSASLKKSLGLVEQVASTDANVLILGETGTGKELIARAVHELSNRKYRPLVKVNCTTLPASLIESELFGHERGAFTGALTRKIGRFELADKGTIFLDEIGDLPLELQAKLLRILQEGEFERLGSHATNSVDVRVIAATNRDIEKQVQEGTFREDLFFRLNVFPILVPPLRERKEDIPVLAKHFIEKYATKLGKQIDVVPVKVINVLQGYDWPGNVRELENIIERAMVISKANKLELGNWFVKTSAGMPETETQTLQEIEKRHILSVLDRTMWRVSGSGGAAEILGVKPTTLESRMKKLGIRRAK